jgi:predicted RNA-binding Zn-ribbon protein involved in translation (DUF1610 family)
MKIQIENHDVNITVETPHSVLVNKNEIMNICGKVYDVIDSIYNPTLITVSDNIDIPEAVKTIKQTQPTIISERDNMVIRPRIPNNAIDIKDLTIKQAVTEQALVRCPKCGQSHILAVNTGNRIYVMRKFYALASKDEFRIIFEFDSLTSNDFLGIYCKPETNRKAYFDDVQKMPMIDDKDFVVNNDTEIFCPVCCKSDTFMNWKEAFENPLRYFETEHLCDACGGEKLEKLIRKHKIYQCDKCGLRTDFKED